MTACFYFVRFRVFLPAFWWFWFVRVQRLASCVSDELCLVLATLMVELLMWWGGLSVGVFVMLCCVDDTLFGLSNGLMPASVLHGNHMRHNWTFRCSLPRSRDALAPQKSWAHDTCLLLPSFSHTHSSTHLLTLLRHGPCLAATSPSTHPVVRLAKAPPQAPQRAPCAAPSQAAARHPSPAHTATPPQPASRGRPLQRHSRSRPPCLPCLSCSWMRLG